MELCTDQNNFQNLPYEQQKPENKISHVNYGLAYVNYDVYVKIRLIKQLCSVKQDFFSSDILFVTTDDQQKKKSRNFMIMQYMMIHKFMIKI